jgi:metallo-beta-lactamase class B
MALLIVGYLIGEFGVERNGPDGQFSASCPPRLTRCATRIWRLVPKRISGDFYWGDDAKYEPVTPDRIVSDGERVEIGGVSLTAHLTPGHTKGRTSWPMRVHEDGKNYDVLFLCGLTVSPYKLTNNDKYPNIVQDERSTLQRLGGMHADVLLAPHGFYFDLEGKVARQKAGAPNLFVDPDEVGRHVSEMKKDLEEALQAQEKQP